MTDDEWSKKQETFDAATTHGEERTLELVNEVSALCGFAMADHSERMGDSVFDGLRLGLAFHDIATEMQSRRASLIAAREGISAIDAEVACGKLPATAHSWRFQLARRLDRLHRAFEQLSAGLAKAEAELRRLCAM